MEIPLLRAKPGHGCSDCCSQLWPQWHTQVTALRGWLVSPAAEAPQTTGTCFSDTSVTKFLQCLLLLKLQLIVAFIMNSESIRPTRATIWIWKPHSSVSAAKHLWGLGHFMWCSTYKHFLNSVFQPWVLACCRNFWIRPIQNTWAHFQWLAFERLNKATSIVRKTFKVTRKKQTCLLSLCSSWKPFVRRRVSLPCH